MARSVGNNEAFAREESARSARNNEVIAIKELVVSARNSEAIARIELARSARNYGAIAREELAKSDRNYGVMAREESCTNKEFRMHILTARLEGLPHVMSYKDYIVHHYVKVLLEFQSYSVCTQ